MYARVAGVLVLVVGLTGLAGCYESADVVIHEPGVYKGTRDPLVAKLRTPELQQQLRERFALVQPDR